MQAVAKKQPKKAKVAKAFSNFFMKIRSRHPSHKVLRKAILLPFRSVFRLGSTTRIEGVTSEGGRIVEINTIEAVKNSANKLLMKHCFQQAGVKTAEWFFWKEGALTRGDDKRVKVAYKDLPFPVVLKNVFGSRGTGNYLIENVEQFEKSLAGKNLANYIVEKYYTFTREYRLHITEDGCFYTCRKMIKNDTPEKDRWFRNDANSNWIREENELFDKPVNWDEIVAECVKALKAVKLDVCSFDIRVQSAKTPKKGKARERAEFIILECNSASSFGEVTAERYLEQIPLLARKLAKKYGIIN